MTKDQVSDLADPDFLLTYSFAMHFDPRMARFRLTRLNLIADTSSAHPLGESSEFAQNAITAGDLAFVEAYSHVDPFHVDDLAITAEEATGPMDSQASFERITLALSLSKDAVIAVRLVNGILGGGYAEAASFERFPRCNLLELQ